jgi:hypothetical protein
VSSSVLTIAFAALIIAEAPVLVWMRVCRNRQIVLKEVEALSQEQQAELTDFIAARTK